MILTLLPYKFFTFNWKLNQISFATYKYVYTLIWNKSFENHLKDKYHLRKQLKHEKSQKKWGSRKLFWQILLRFVEMVEYQGNSPIILSEAFWQTKEVPFVLVTRCNLFASAKTKGISPDFPPSCTFTFTSLPQFLSENEWMWRLVKIYCNVAVD